ncbi:MAG: histidinol-phosphate transaminase [Chromatiales bacterium]|nr:histidinol-phosphate transaminase [Chromatiales bacterium]MDH4030969.1 histidinol-phosphate transaminase [Chromatiales bacterium]
MSGPLSLARPDLRDFVPYEAAAPDRQMIRLHANESAWRHPWDDSEAGLNRYPDPRAERLTRRLAEIYGARANELLLTRGSDDAIDVLARAFCVAMQDRVLVCPPSFGMYAIAARLQGAGVIEVPLDAGRDFSLDEEKLLAAAADVKIVFLCSPNNPTGNVIPAETIAKICDRLTDRALVVVDEAYAEFAGAPSAIDLRPYHDNLVILRTLSKAYALAGARLGVLVADPVVVRLLRGVLPPYPLPSPCLEAAERLMAPEALEQARHAVADSVARRRRLADALTGLSCVTRVWPSEGNFVLVRFRDADLAVESCRKRGVLLRDFSRKPGLEGCVRITVGEEDENRLVLETLETLQ